MKAHRNLTRQQVVDKGPSAILLMIASEFGRAASRSQHRESVLNCYHRAKELMGILETMALPEGLTHRIKPFFARVSESELLREKRLTPLFLQKSCAELADEFNRAASRI